MLTFGESGWKEIRNVFAVFSQHFVAEIISESNQQKIKKMFRIATIAAVVAVGKLGTANFVETKLCSLSESQGSSHQQEAAVRAGAEGSGLSLNFTLTY